MRYLWRIFITDLIHHLLLFAAGLVFLCVISLSALRLILPFIPEHQVFLEKAISTWAEKPITFEQININWHKLQPEIELTNVHVWNEKHQSILHIPQMNLRVSLWSSLVHRDLELSLLQIKDWNVGIKQDAQKQWKVIGLNYLTAADAAAHPPMTMDQVLATFSEINALQLQNSRIEIEPFDQPALMLDQTNMQWRFNHGQLKLYGNTVLQSPSQCELQFSAALKGDPSTQKLSGDLYIKTSALDLQPWLNQKT